ncbi:ribonuclease P protein component [Candidatus Marinimicrobia bacterium]|nr:ribonuclease P protein component [Candidatus Neomarinimicrobiota bacterium]
MKYSLSSKEINNVFSSTCKFRTKNLSFKYLLNSEPGIAFSVGKRAGNAVLRNKFKRKIRNLAFNTLFSNNVQILIHPISTLHKNMSFADDFGLFQLHLQKRS